MTVPTQTNDTSPATPETQDLGALSFVDYQRVRRGEAAVEKVQSKSAPESKDAEQNKVTASDTVNEEDDESGEESEGDGDELDSKGSETDQPRKKSGSQRRKERAERAEAEVSRLQRVIEETALKGAGAPKSELKIETTKADEAGKPDPDKFETHAEYVEALTDWKIDQKDKAKAEESRKSEIEAGFKTLMESHYEREKAFLKKTPDYTKTMKEAGLLKDASAAVSECITSSEIGPEIMYELAKNKAEYERINKLPPLAAARAIGKIEARLSEAEKPEQKKTTSAPKPIEPVGSGKGHVEKSISDPNLSFADYERIRREQTKRKRG